MEMPGIAQPGSPDRIASRAFAPHGIVRQAVLACLTIQSPSPMIATKVEAARGKKLHASAAIL
jgi:hypothetical protein